MTNEELAVLIQHGDTEKLPELWQGVELLSKKFAAKYARSITHNGTTGDEQTLFEDLHSCGYPALVAAVQTYKPGEGTAFSSWFIYYFRNEIRRFMGWRCVEAGKTVNTDLYNAAISLDEELTEDGTTRQDLAADPADSFEEVERRIYNEQLHKALDAAMALIPAREAAALRWTYYEGLTLEQQAERLGTSIEWARALQMQGLRDMRRGEPLRILRQFRGGTRERKRPSISDAYKQSTERLAVMLADTEAERRCWGKLNAPPYHSGAEKEKPATPTQAMRMTPLGDNPETPGNSVPGKGDGICR